LSRDSPCQRKIVAYNFPSARDINASSSSR
jgi:hypothetical protein